jgi:hypothetical protein
LQRDGRYGDDQATRADADSESHADGKSVDRDHPDADGDSNAHP